MAHNAAEAFPNWDLTGGTNPSFVQPDKLVPESGKVRVGIKASNTKMELTATVITLSSPAGMGVKEK